MFFDGINRITVARKSLVINRIHGLVPVPVSDYNSSSPVTSMTIISMISILFVSNPDDSSGVGRGSHCHCFFDV